MKSMLFKQIKPIKVKILGVFILCIIPYVVFQYDSPISQIMTMLLIGVVLLGYSVSYEIKKGFDNYKHFAIFGITIWRQKLNLDFPDYISIFGASFKQDNEWGTVSALGTQAKNDAIVIRLFHESKYFTLFKTNTYEIALTRAKELGELLNVEIHDATKQ